MNSKMTVTVYPSLAAALITEGAEIRAVRLDGESQISDCTAQMGLLFSHAGETITSDKLSDDEAIHRLVQEETAKQRALTFVLVGADKSLRVENRRGSILLAEDALRSVVVREFVRGRLLGCKPPKDAVFDEAKRLALDAQAYLVASIYLQVTSCRSFIEPVVRRFEEVVLYDLPTNGDVRSVMRTLIDAGVIGSMVLAVAEGDGGKLNAVALNFAHGKVLNEGIPRLSHVLAKVSSILRTDFQLQRSPVSVTPAQAPEAEDPWVGEVAKWVEERDEHRRHFKDHAVESRFTTAVRDKVNHQVEYIQRLLIGRDLAGVEDAVLELIRYQRKNSALRHVCKSLSRLAAIAVNYADYDVARRLYGAAQRANDDDHFVHCGYAQMLRSMGLLNDALTAYQDAKERFTEESVPHNGYAETLRELGRVEEALAAYAESKRRFEADSVAFCGYAETLREMGRLKEALAAYAQATELFETDSAPFCGYAETLREVGRLQQALQVYADAKKRFEDNPIPFNGYAETLREMGRLKDAFTAYSEVRNRFPWDFIGFCGYAETLRDMGQLEEALAAYADARKRFGDVEESFSGYAETLRQLGRSSEAEDVYREMLQRFPGNRVAKNALASLLINLGASGPAIDLLAAPVAPSSKQDWRDFHVAAIGYLRQGDIHEALKRIQFGAESAPFAQLRSLFRCTYAVHSLRANESRQALNLLELPDRRVPFPEWTVVKAHAEAETKRFEMAAANLESINFHRHLMPAIKLVNHIYGLDRPPAPFRERASLVSELWEEELRLLTSVAGRPQAEIIFDYLPELVAEDDVD